MAAQVLDICPGLWLWRQPHPAWHAGIGWKPEVSSFAVESGGVALILDPLAPPPSSRDVWDRLEEKPPDVVAILKPDHLRDFDLFVRWYGARAFGPSLFWPDDLPRSDLEPLLRDEELPGGLQALDDGRGMLETPLYLPEHRTLVFADGMTAPDGTLQIWGRPSYEKRVLPAFREMLALPFERVLVSHGEPIHDRGAFEAALDLDPYWG